MARRDALLRLHQSLLARRTAIRSALAGELADLRRESTAQTGDSAAVGFDADREEIAAQLAEIEARELTMIDQALQRLKQGAYGTCEMCQAKISVARMNALPYSATCIRCQRQVEEYEGVASVPARLAAEHPGCPIFRVPEDHPTEVVCETSRTAWPDQSVAIAYIDRSCPHVHRKTIEVYLVEEGSLTVHLGGKPVELRAGEVLVITPGTVHWAEGKATRVRVIASPAWTPEDHILVER